MAYAPVELVVLASSGPTPESWPVNATFTPPTPPPVPESVTVPETVPVGDPGAGGRLVSAIGSTSSAPDVEAK